MEPGVRNIERLEKALAEAEKFTTGNLSSYPEASQLYKLRLQNLERVRQELSKQAALDQKNKGNSAAADSRWNVLKAVPIIEDPSQQEDLSKKYSSIVDGFRVKFYKQKKEAQTHSNVPASSVQPERTEPNQVSGIFLNQSNPKVDIFSKKFEEQPNETQLRVFKPAMSLFSERNPWSDQEIKPLEKNAFNVFANNSKKQTENKNNIFGELPKNSEPATNIFSKTLVAPASEQLIQKPVFGGNLFSPKNPWAEQEKQVKSNDSQALNLFNNPTLFSQNQKKQNEKNQVAIPSEVPAQPTPSKLFDKIQNKKEEPEKADQLFSKPPTSIFSKNPITSPAQPAKKNQAQPSTLFGGSPSKLFNKPIFGENVQPVFQNLGPPGNQGSIFSGAHFQKHSEDQNKQSSSKEEKKNTPLFGQNAGSSNIFNNPVKKDIFGGNETLFGKAIQPEQPAAKAEKEAPKSLFGNALQGKASSPLFAGNKDGKKEGSSIFGEVKQSSSLFGNSLFSSKVPDKNPEELENPKKSSVQNEEVQQSSQEKKRVSQIFEGLKEKPNIFSQKNQTKQNQSTTKPAIFGGFGNPLPASGNIFAPTGGSIFQTKPKDGENPLFGNKGGLFSSAGNAEKEDKNIQENDNEQNEEGDDEPLQAQDEADPTKSTGNYQYEKPDILFKETALKLRKGQQEMRDNVIVSIQKYANNPNKMLYVRLQNKIVYFFGTILPRITEVTRISNDSYLNLTVKKIAISVEDGKPKLELFKVKFKDEKSGKTFYDLLGS